MIQANGEAYGFQGVTVTLSGYAVGGSAITDTVDLTAGVDYRGTKSNSTVICTDANSVTSSCAGANSDTAQVFGTDSSPGGTPGNTVVTYNNVYGGQTSGIRNYYLDAQELELGGIFAGAYLDSVTITNDSPSGGDGTILFSGLTLNQDSPVVPEPSTIALLGIGLSLGAFLKIRSRRASACQQSVG
jgi:hypothetical protein